MKYTQNIRLYGRVQGVFFRESMCRKAEELGVCGWVRNCGDGSVEAMLQGSEEAVTALIEWARKGPAPARVDRLDVMEGSGEYADFRRRGNSDA